MRKKGNFYKSKPFIYVEGKIYVGDTDEFHLDLAEKHPQILDDWLTRETYNGRVWDKNGKYDRCDIYEEEQLTKTTKTQIEDALRKHYGAEGDTPLVEGRTFSGAVATSGPPVSGRALRPDKFTERELAQYMNQPYIAVAEIGDVDYSWLVGTETEKMPNCVGMITEKGGALSHFALVGREQEVPYVVASSAKKIRNLDHVDLYTNADDKPGYPAGTVDVNGGGEAHAGKSIGKPSHSFAWSKGNTIINEDINSDTKKRYLMDHGLWDDNHATHGNVHEGGYVHHFNEDMHPSALADFEQWAKYNTPVSVHTVSTDEPVYEKEIPHENMRFCWYGGHVHHRDVDLNHPGNPDTLHSAIIQELQTANPMDMGLMIGDPNVILQGVGYTNGDADIYSGDNLNRIQELESQLRAMGYKHFHYGGYYGGVAKESAKQNTLRKCPNCGSHTTFILDGEDKKLKCHNCGNEWKDKELIKNPKKSARDIKDPDDEFIMNHFSGYYDDGSCDQCGSDSVKEDGQCYNCGYVNEDEPRMPVPNTEEYGTGWDDWPSTSIEAHFDTGLVMDDMPSWIEQNRQVEEEMERIALHHYHIKDRGPDDPQYKGVQKESPAICPDCGKQGTKRSPNQFVCPLGHIWSDQTRREKRTVEAARPDAGFEDWVCPECGAEGRDNVYEAPEGGFECRNCGHPITSKESASEKVAIEWDWGKKSLEDTRNWAKARGIYDCPRCGSQMQEDDEGIVDWECPDCGYIQTDVDNWEDEGGAIHPDSREGGAKEVAPKPDPQTSLDLGDTQNTNASGGSHIVWMDDASPQDSDISFGYIDGTLYLSESHHAGIMNELAQQSGEDLLTWTIAASQLKQMWGWIETDTYNYHTEEYSDGPTSASVRFASDSAIQTPEIRPQVLAAIAKALGISEDDIQSYDASGGGFGSKFQVGEGEYGGRAIEKYKEGAFTQRFVVRLAENEWGNVYLKNPDRWVIWDMEADAPLTFYHDRQEAIIKAAELNEQEKTAATDPSNTVKSTLKKCPHCGAKDWEKYVSAKGNKKYKCNNCGMKYHSDASKLKSNLPGPSVNEPISPDYGEDSDWHEDDQDDSYNNENNYPMSISQKVIPLESLAGKTIGTRFGYIQSPKHPEGRILTNNEDHYPIMDAFREQDFDGDWMPLWSAKQLWGVINSSKKTVTFYLTTDVGRLDMDVAPEMKEYVAKLWGIPPDDVYVPEHGNQNTSDYGHSTFLNYEAPGKPTFEQERGTVKATKVAKVADTHGHPLAPGRTYIMRSVKYKVPDIVMIKDVQPNTISAVIAGDNKGYFPIDITTDDYEKFKYSFEPKAASMQKGSPYPEHSYKNAPDHTPKHQKKWPKEVNAIYNACMREGNGSGDTKEEQESSCAAIAWAQYNKGKRKKSSPVVDLGEDYELLKHHFGNEVERVFGKQGAPIGEAGSTDPEYCSLCGSDDAENQNVGNYRIWSCNNCGNKWDEQLTMADEYDSNPPADARSEDTDTMLQDFGGGMAMANLDDKEAAKSSLSMKEQQDLINEQGVARNIDKLNLDGTHYNVNEEEDELDAHFLW